MGMGLGTDRARGRGGGGAGGGVLPAAALEAEVDALEHLCHVVHESMWMGRVGSGQSSQQGIHLL